MDTIHGGKDGNKPNLVCMAEQYGHAKVYMGIIMTCWSN